MPSALLGERDTGAAASQVKTNMHAEITRMTPNGRTKLSTHVLDLVSGLPAPGLAVKLYDPEVALISSAITNEDGRIEAWDGAVDFGSGTYRLVFDIAGYRQAHGASEHDLLFPRIEIIFHLDGSRSRLHIPVLLSNYGYTTYRGS